MRTIKVATYNIHKCVGMDRKYSPERIAEVLEEVDADVIALQEVLCHTGLSVRDHQAEFIATRLGMDFRLGENRKINGGEYGNAILSRLPIVQHENHDITVSRYEPRGCLHAEIELNGSGKLHFANVHMGTSYFERRQQVHKLLAEHVLHRPGMLGKRIVAGDFNEWVTGVTTKLFKAAFNSVDPKLHLGTRRSFPGILPVVHLDHVYFDEDIKLRNAAIHRSRTALVASDHLPIVAEFEF
ncbi:MAG: endonuclease/exonuclease/phosphatase family protein [Pyrinomonadaceae bacterium]|nr:endonuclease/exonuclease/phosphatase family protein [Pyrinomonadaceae bacterium]